MSSRFHKDLKQILHPYLFVLREGQTIRNNLLDYSLLMLHVNCLEIIKTPAKDQQNPLIPPALSEKHPGSLEADEQETLSLLPAEKRRSKIG